MRPEKNRERPGVINFRRFSVRLVAEPYLAVDECHWCWAYCFYYITKIFRAASAESQGRRCRRGPRGRILRDKNILLYIVRPNDDFGSRKSPKGLPDPPSPPPPTTSPMLPRGDHPIINSVIKIITGPRSLPIRLCTPCMHITCRKHRKITTGFFCIGSEVDLDYNIKPSIPV